MLEQAALLSGYLIKKPTNLKSVSIMLYVLKYKSFLEHFEKIVIVFVSKYKRLAISFTGISFCSQRTSNISFVFLLLFDVYVREGVFLDKTFQIAG